MDYTERLDMLIEQFSSETKGLLARISEIRDGIEYIDEDIGSLTEELAEYERNVESSSKKIAAAGSVFAELKQAIANLSEDVLAIDNEQQCQTETLKALCSLDEIGKNIVQISHSVNDGNSKAENAFSIIKKNELIIADEQRMLAAKIDRTAKNVETIRDRHNVIEGQLTQQNAVIEGALQGVKEAAGKCTELQTSIKDLQGLFGGIAKNCDELQMAYGLISGRIDSLADDLRVSRAKAEENDKRTQELLEIVLSRMNSMESILTTKKRGLFK